MNNHTRIIFCAKDTDDLNITVNMSSNGNVIGIVARKEKLKEIESLFKSVQVFWKE